VAAPSPDSPAGRAARLRDAAAGGQTADVAALLAKRVPVDAPDAEGETALMKAVQANQPAVVALLRRHGASLDRKNHAGVSARDMATAIGDAELNRALGLGP
jgi:ankyrin repeat protein